MGISISIICYWKGIMGSYLWHCVTTGVTTGTANKKYFSFSKQGSRHHNLLKEKLWKTKN